MSSVSSSDRGDRVRKVREEYEAKEAENQKKKKAEVDSLNSKHYEEINRLSDDFGHEMEQLKQHYRENLTDRDQANMRKVDDLRALYKDQLRKKIEENENDRREVRKAANGTIQKVKSTGDAQRENLLENHKAEMAERDERFEKTANDYRDKMQEGLDHRDHQLKEAHGKEMNATIEGRDRALSEKNREMNATKKSMQAELKAERQKRESEVGHWQQKFVDTVKNNEESNADAQQNQGAILRGEVDHIHDKFNAAIDKKYEEMDQASDNLRDSVNDRLNTQVRSKQSKIEQLNSKLNSVISSSERLKNIERQELERRQAAQIDLLDKQKKGGIEQARDMANKRVGETLQRTDKLLRDTNRNYRSESDLTNQRNRADREFLMQQQQDTLEHVVGSAENHVKKVTKAAHDNQEAYSNYYDHSLDQMKDNFEDRVSAQRDHNTDDMVRVNKTMTQKFRGIEKTFDQRLENLTSGYESKINQMKENHEKELKRIEAYYSQRLNGKDKEVKQVAGSVEMKYEAKIAQLNEAHEEQLDRMNRRHQEDMQNLSTKMSNYSKKA